MLVTYVSLGTFLHLIGGKRYLKKNEGKWELCENAGVINSTKDLSLRKN